MAVVTKNLKLSTRGDTDVHDLTDRVAQALREAGIRDGTVTVFVPGSTAGVTTIEYEDGVVGDLRDAIERVAPRNIPYAHDAKWGDGNGYAHVRAALLGPSLSVPFQGGRLLLGRWQQIVLVDFDNRPRKREVVVQIVGE
ncbi:MAG: secondary thiamine-phosphate synthase enzyme [Deltaproteobacteria bacterium RBG_13_65_10]|nr:MAG: secondary thiamine-phosphate synthase enzyme [Deltaproteobacteria bacterium RBG_13_65_10]